MVAIHPVLDQAIRLHPRFSGVNEVKQGHVLTATSQPEIVHMLQQLFRHGRWYLERWIVAMIAEQVIEVFIHQQRHLQLSIILTMVDVCKT